MKTSEFTRLFLFRRKGRSSYFDYCFVTAPNYPKDGEVYTFTGTNGKRDQKGCFGRRFISDKGDKKVLTWQQMCQIDVAPFLTSEEAVRKVRQAEWTDLHTELSGGHIYKRIFKRKK